jgi:hypothetical protein
MQINQATAYITCKLQKNIGIHGWYVVEWNHLELSKINGEIYAYLNQSFASTSMPPITATQA